MSDATNRGRVPKDLVAGGLFLVIGITVLLLIPEFVTAADRGLEVGPRYLPRMMGIAITALSLALILRTLVQVKTRTAEWIEIRSVVPTLRGLGVVGLVLLWLFGLRVTTYLVVSPIVVVLGLLMFKVRKVVLYGVGIGFVVAVWAMFTWVLQVRLP